MKSGNRTCWFFHRLLHWAPLPFPSQTDSDQTFVQPWPSRIRERKEEEAGIKAVCQKRVRVSPGSKIEPYPVLQQPEILEKDPIHINSPKPQALIILFFSPPFYKQFDECPSFRSNLRWVPTSKSGRPLKFLNMSMQGVIGKTPWADESFRIGSRAVESDFKKSDKSRIPKLF